MTTRRLQQIIGSCAVVLGLSFTVLLNAQSFSAPVENPFGLVPINVGYGYFPSFVDLDGDGDLDLYMGAYIYDEEKNTLYYYENSGTSVSPKFETPVENPHDLNLEGNFSPFPEFADLDGDGGLDVSILNLNEFFYKTELLFFENIGDKNNPEFKTPVINPFGLDQFFLLYLSFPCFADMDNDGDLDLFSQSYEGNMYNENIGTKTNPLFTEPVIHPFGLISQADMTTPELVDIDGDGDFDLFNGSFDNGAFLFFENEGTAESASFGMVQTNPFGLVSLDYVSIPTFGDLDGDGDIDLLALDYNTNMQYFENITEPSIVVDPKSEFVVFISPNPVEDFISIETDRDLLEMDLLDVHGNLIQNFPGNSRSLNTSFLAKGIYFLKFREQSGNFTIRKFIKT